MSRILSPIFIRSIFRNSDSMVSFNIKKQQLLKTLTKKVLLEHTNL